MAAEETNINSDIQENQNEEGNNQTNNQTQEQEKFDYRKAREERLIKNTEKRILRDLGVNSFEDAKNLISKSEELEKELDFQRDNHQKIKAYKAGIDDKFVDYVTYEVKRSLKENQKFEDVLKEFTKKNPQYLRNFSNIKFNSSPDFESSKNIKFNPNKWMNSFLRGQTQK